MTDDFSDHLERQWQNERPDLDSQGVFALYARLARLTRHLESQLFELQKDHGLNRGELDVLATLRRSGPPYALTPTQLYRASLLTSGAMTSRIDRLEKEGLVLRSANADDRRSNRVKLTPRGQQLIDDFLPYHLDLEKQLISVLSKNEQQMLSGLLKKWLLTIEPH